MNVWQHISLPSQYSYLTAGLLFVRFNTSTCDVMSEHDLNSRF